MKGAFASAMMAGMGKSNARLRFEESEMNRDAVLVTACDDEGQREEVVKKLCDSKRGTRRTHACMCEGSKKMREGGIRLDEHYVSSIFTIQEFVNAQGHEVIVVDTLSLAKVPMVGADISLPVVGKR